MEIGLFLTIQFYDGQVIRLDHVVSVLDEEDTFFVFFDDGHSVSYDPAEIFKFRVSSLSSSWPSSSDYCKSVFGQDFSLD